MKYVDEFKKLLYETLVEHKKLILGLYALFIICLIGAWTLAPPISTDISGAAISGDGAGEQSGALELFINNEGGGIVTYITSVFFAIPAFVMLIYNAINLGMIGHLFDSIIPNGGLHYIVYLIPHGIFEITGTIIQSSAGILLFMFIYRFVRSYISNRSMGLSYSFDLTKKLLIQSIVLMIFSTILILIAAPIEAYFSVPFSDLIFGT